MSCSSLKTVTSHKLVISEKKMIIFSDYEKAGKFYILVVNEFLFVFFQQFGVSSNQFHVTTGGGVVMTT